MGEKHVKIIHTSDGSVDFGWNGLVNLLLTLGTGKKTYLRQKLPSHGAATVWPPRKLTGQGTWQLGIHNHAEQDSEQPDLAVDVSVHCRGGWTRWPLMVPFDSNNSMILLFCDCYAPATSVLLISIPLYSFIALTHFSVSSQLSMLVHKRLFFIKCHR